MDIGEMIGSSFAYAKEGLVGKWERWALLLISAIIFPLLSGYLLRVYRGVVPAPEPDDWVKMFVDGILVIVIRLIYAIPVAIVYGLVFVTYVFALIANPDSATGADGMIPLGMIIGLIVTFVLAFITALILNFAIIRFAREEKFGEAFNLKEILASISRVGWLSYIVELLVFVIVVGLIVFVLELILIFAIIILLSLTPVLLIPLIFIAIVIYLLALPFFAIWQARYLNLIYENEA